MGKHDEEIARLEAKHKPREVYDECYNQGYIARGLGKDVGSGPYPLLSLEESYWIRGWHQAGVDSRRRKPKFEPEPDEPEGFTIL